MKTIAGAPFPRIISSVAADYSKRWADSNLWDSLMATPTGRWFVGLSRNQKLTAEMIAYLSSAIVKWHLGDHTPLRQYLSEVGGDAIPELAQRMLDGRGTPADSPGTSPSPSSPDPSGLTALLTMDPKDRQVLLEWLRTTDRETRERFEKLWVKMTALQISMVSHLSPEERKTLLELTTKPPRTKKVGEHLREGLRTLTARLNSWAGRS